MNTEELTAKLNAAQTLINEVRDALNPLPPPPPPPPAPSLAIATHYNAITFEFAAAAHDGGAFNLQWRAHPSDTTGHGPQEWTDLQSSGVPNLTTHGARDRILEVRAWVEREGQRSEDATLVIALNDYLPPIE